MDVNRKPGWATAILLLIACGGPELIRPQADLLAGLLLTLLYLWRRDLLANVLAHSTGLVIGMLAFC